MDMLEKVAAALAEELNHGPQHIEHSEALTLAAVAIEAMREPTPEMIKAGADEMAGFDPKDDALDAWPAMIDAALDKKGPSKEKTK